MKEKELVDLRLSKGLKQLEVAKAFSMSRSKLAMIENGQRSCSSDLYQSLKDYYLNYRQEDGLVAKFDWVRVRIPTNDVSTVIEKILIMDYDVFHEMPTGKFGYSSCYECDMIRVFGSHKGSDKGTLIELSGQGCRQYESILNELDETWKAFFSRCFIFKGVARRIDVAIDDYLEYFSLEQMIKKMERKEYKTKFKKNRVINSENIVDGVSAGKTVYWGSRSSLLYFCFYQKNYEQAEKLGVAVDEIDVKNRYEMRFAHEKAEKLISAYLNGQDLLRVGKDVLSKQLTMLATKKDGSVFLWSEWKKFLGRVGEIDLSMSIEKPSFDRKIRWLKNYCSQSLKLIDLVGKERHTDYISEIIAAAELNDKNEKLLDIEMRDTYELISSDISVNVFTGEKMVI